MKNSLILFLLLNTSLSFCFGQKVDVLPSFKDLSSSKYLRFNYENDLFMRLDKDYTQGFSLEFVAPLIKKNPINHLLYKPVNSKIRYGIALEHNSFTPNKYFVPEIQIGDRPFAAALMIKSFAIAIDAIKAIRITSSFNIGMIGPVALGEEIQVAIHNATNSGNPLGWDNQIKDDIVLNYGVGYEKQLIRFRDLFSLEVYANGKIGSLNTKGTIGINTAIGILNSPFSAINKRKNFNLYFYAQPLINIVGYDATLQGGVFNKKSPYVIPSKDIERFTGQFNYGFILRIKSVYFEYSGAFLTREFKTGGAAKWGGFKIGLML